MGWVGPADLRFEAPIGPSESGGGRTKGGVEVCGDVEGKSHPGIEELRLALSKKDFGGFSANRFSEERDACQSGKEVGNNPILSSTKSPKAIASPSFAPHGAYPAIFAIIHEKTSHSNASIH